MLLGLREHEVRSNPWVSGVKIPFGPNNIILIIEKGNFISMKLPFYIETRYIVSNME